MKKTYFIVNILWLTLAAAVCVESWWLNVGTFRAPGPGFLPFFASILLGILSLISLFQSFTEGEGELAKIWAGTHLLKLGLLILALFLYVALLNTIGFLLGTFFLMLFLFRVMEPYSWRAVLLASVLTIGTTYVIFGILLESRLPKGLLGF